MKILIFVLLIATTAIYSLDNSNTIFKVLDSFMDAKPKELFKIWHLLFRKTYTFDSEEAKQRFRNFKDKLALIKKVNSENLGYTLGLNEFSDLTTEEFTSQYLGLINTPYAPEKNFLTEDESDDLTKRNLLTADAIDFRRFFATPRNQGNCGSCWTFSAAGAIEGNYNFRYNTTTPYLSTQQLVDCETRFSSGCNGGWFDKAMDYVQANGIMRESDYPYRAVQGQCRYNRAYPLIYTKGYKYCISSGNRCTPQIAYGLLQGGPASVTIYADQYLQSYRGGIYSNACNAQYANHAIILVGYGVEAATNRAYWMIRNSWGATWGEAGYGRVLVNDSNRYSCFITERVYVPQV